MDYEHEDIGPALKRLRQAAGIKQKEVAVTIRRSGANVSRIEREGSNPKLASLFRYLRAIGADLSDLCRELDEPADALDEAVATVDRRIREEPGYRQLARDMLERFGGPELPPGLRALADLVDRQGEQIERQREQLDDYEGRLSKLEEQGPEG